MSDNTITENTSVVVPDASPAAVGEVEAALKAFEDGGGVVATDDESVAGVEPGDQPAAPASGSTEKPKLGSEEELSSGWAALRSRQDRFQKDREELKAEREAINKERESFKSEKEETSKLVSEYKGRIEKARKNPIEALQELGWTVEQTLKYIDQNGTVPVEVIESGLRAEFKKESDEIKAELQKERDSLKLQREERETVEKKQKETEFARSFEKRASEEFDSLIKNEPQKYKYLAKVPRDIAIVDILGRMINAYKSEKKSLAISDAMLYAESEAKKQAGWFGVVDATQSDPQQARDVKSSNPGQERIEPISNSDLNRGGVVAKKTPDDMTDEERLEEAMKLYK